LASRLIADAETARAISVAGRRWSDPHRRLAAGAQAEARVAAALAAGGRIVRDEFAPSWWTLADSAGNEADIATVSGRD
jgi:hypothetical protein